MNNIFDYDSLLTKAYNKRPIIKMIREETDIILLIEYVYTVKHINNKTFEQYIYTLECFNQREILKYIYMYE